MELPDQLYQPDAVSTLCPDAPAPVTTVVSLTPAEAVAAVVESTAFSAMTVVSV